MARKRKIFSGLSFKLDTLFFRNLTLLLAAIFIWRGIWNLLDTYFIPHDKFLSNIIIILIGIFLLFVFDSEVEEEARAKRKRPVRHFDDFL
jgi:uncharacterized membrane protein YbhN (UPF0104 family)